MNKSENKYLIPLMLPLDGKIEAECHFLKLPAALKEKLLRLEELSRNGRGNRGRFIREKHYLPLDSLKKLFISFLPGVTEMKAVGLRTDDSRWLVSTEKIDVGMTVKIFKIWIEAFYIGETELDKKRNNEPEAKEYAGRLIRELDEEMFRECAYFKKLQLFDNGEVVDKDAYSLFPMLAVAKMTGSRLVLNGESAVWMYSRKNEIVTDPLAYSDSQGKEQVSFVVNFSVQTIPPYNKPYLDVKITSRRWISRNEAGKVPYYKDKKSVYIRIDDRKLQVVGAKYQYPSAKMAWLPSDEKSFRGVYGNDGPAPFDAVILNPELYMKGKPQYDAYVPFEYGMKDGKGQMHSQDAGIAHQDRSGIFADVTEKLKLYSGGPQKALHKVGNDSITADFFDDDLHFSEKAGAREAFQEIASAVCGDGELTIEVCYSSGQEELREKLCAILQEHLAGTQIELKKVQLKSGLTEALDCSDLKSRDNLAGYHARIDEIRQELPNVKNHTMSIVIIHEPGEYKIGGKEDARVDPKDALRVGFADTGRLTQFITFENHENNEYKVQSAILDAYRQLGIHRALTDRKKKTTLIRKIAVGIHVCNYKNLKDDISAAPFPIIVSCDLTRHRIEVETAVVLISKFSNQAEGVERIRCGYDEFPLQLRALLDKAKRGKRIQAYDHFLKEWFAGLRKDCRYEIMIAADGTSRKLVEGITNKDIQMSYNAETGYTEDLLISSRTNDRVNLRECGNVDVLRLRVNDEVPDYIPGEHEDQSRFVNTSGIYAFDKVYYSQDKRPFAENKTFQFSSSKLTDDRAFSHRRLVEIYPLYICEGEDELECVRDVHNLREANLQYQAAKTVLPMPLHLGSLLEEYMI